MGVQFKTWLLHVTVVPWFRLDDDSQNVTEGLRQAFHGIAPFEVTTGGEAMFGPRGNRPVRLLKPAGQLEQIEAKTRSYLHKKRAFLIDETTKKPYSFRPHVTAQSGFLLPEDATFHIGQLYVVEQKGGYKEVVAEAKLADRNKTV